MECSLQQESAVLLTPEEKERIAMAVAFQFVIDPGLIIALMTAVPLVVVLKVIK
jgi:hypothetical protein